jgi:microcin C transport system substrate-binding protein
VNPAAPKGGNITLSYIGTFDNFNRFALRGNAAVRTESLYDSLFTTSDDEPGSYYPLIAEVARYADDFHGSRSRSIRAPVPRRLTYSGQRCGVHLP